MTGLPLFLHCRDAAEDLASILGRWRDRLHGGVVHSFDGDMEELNTFLDMDLYIGVNGCSLKTEENLKVAAEIPLGWFQWGYAFRCDHMYGLTVDKGKAGGMGSFFIWLTRSYFGHIKLNAS